MDESNGHSEDERSDYGDEDERGRQDTRRRYRYEYSSSESEMNTVDCSHGMMDAVWATVDSGAATSCLPLALQRRLISPTRMPVENLWRSTASVAQAWPLPISTVLVNGEDQEQIWRVCRTMRLWRYPIKRNLQLTRATRIIAITMLIRAIICLLASSLCSPGQDRPCRHGRCAEWSRSGSGSNSAIFEKMPKITWWNFKDFWFGEDSNPFWWT